MTSAASAQNSIAKSRSATASSEFSHRPSKPSSRATRERSIGKLVPASAAAPSGQPVDAAAALREPLAVALQHLDVSEQVMAEGDRLRNLQVRKARHHQAACLAACASSARSGRR